MAGSVLPLWYARELDFSDLGADETESFVLAKAVDLTAFREAILLIRVHSVLITGSPTFAVRAFVTSPSTSDPSADFVHTGVTLANASIVGTSAGALVRSVFGVRFGGFVRVTVVATQPRTSQETIRARLSAGVLVRQ
jgi:hypothetical protein